MNDKHIVIVGAGHAGGRAAEALRAAGHTGRVTLVGSEKHPPYERPPLSKELLAGAIEHAKTYLNPEAFYAETPPEEADEVISAEQAREYIQIARRVLRWARGIIL